MAKPKIRFKGYTDDWEQRKFGDLVEKYEDPIDTPTDGYMRLGIRSHAKGTFHSYVEKGKELETAKMFRVAANNFIVNITFGWEHAVAITDESDAGKLVSHRFPQYSFENGMIPMFFKYLILDENFKHHLELSSPGGAGRNRVLKLNDMLEYKMKFPCEDEQRKLASYFDDLDHLITLHQRKCEETKKLKKYMLQKMFPQNGQTVPEIRFSGFTDAWEQRKFGDLVEKYEDPIDTPTDGYMRLGIRSHAKGTFHSYVEKGKELETAKMFRVAANNFIVNITFGWEHAVAITDESDAGKLVSHRFPQYSFENGMIPMFFKYLILDENFKHHLELSSPGGAGRNRVLKLNDMLEYKMKFPCEDEQRKLASYFDDLDHLITLHQRKCEETKKLKKYMLQKMFPQNGQTVPEIRFSGFTDAWEQRKLGDVLISLQNNTFSRADLSNESGVAKNVHYGDVLIKFGEVLDVSKEQLPMILDESVLTKYKASFLQNGDVIVADTAEDSTVGKCSEIAGLNDEVILSGLHTIPYRPAEKFATGYLGYYLNSCAYHNQLIPLMQGIKVTSISKSAMQDTDIVYPKLMEEQTEIGNYFYALDHLITLHQYKCEQLQSMKKFMLQNMFV